MSGLYDTVDPAAIGRRTYPNPALKWDMEKLQRLESECEINRRIEGARFASYLEHLQNARELHERATRSATNAGESPPLSELVEMSPEQLMTVGKWPELMERAVREFKSAKLIYAQWEQRRSALNAQFQFVERLRRATGEFEL